MMDRDQAITEIDAIFGTYAASMPSDTALLRSLSDGKLYELYVLSELIADLDRRGFAIRFVGRTLSFKGAPGQIKLGDPHFELRAPNGAPLWLFVDIEFRTLGSTQVPVSDYSGYHEIDIVVVTDTPPMPSHEQIALAVECKCVAKFGKKLVKEALGVRRELSYFADQQPSILSQLGGSHVAVGAEPPSEFWLAHVDRAGNAYDESPRAFGIELRHLEP